MKTDWMMTQEWHDLVFYHWPLDPEALRTHIPKEVELDTFNGAAWLGVVSFEAKGTRPRFMPPVPGIKQYLELNVRTYVKYNGRSGVYFFTLDADSMLAVWTANTLLPYRHAKMALNKKGSKQRFSSRRIQAKTFPELFDATYTIASRFIEQTELEFWLTERYSLWAKPAGRLLRIDIRHEPWQLQQVTCYEIRRNSLAAFIRTDWRTRTPLVHYSKFKKVWFYPPAAESDPSSI